MALDPRISLAATAPIVEPPDLIRTMLAAGQLREQQSIQGLRDLQARQLQEDFAADERIAAVWRSYGVSPIDLQTRSSAMTPPGGRPVTSPLNPQMAAGPITQRPMGQGAAVPGQERPGPPAPFGAGSGVVSEFGPGGAHR
jgi:hypothetical protein